MRWDYPPLDIIIIIITIIIIIYYYYYCYHYIGFTSLSLSMDFPCSPSISKIPYNSRTFLMILALSSKTVVCIW